MLTKQELTTTRYLTGPQVCTRYYRYVSLWRWLRDAELGFPQPKLRVRGRRYWSADDLTAWEQDQKRQHASRTA
jgi:hypothetical protein